MMFSRISHTYIFYELRMKWHKNAKKYIFLHTYVQTQCCLDNESMAKSKSVKNFFLSFFAQTKAKSKT